MVYRRIRGAVSEPWNRGWLLAIAFILVGGVATLLLDDPTGGVQPLPAAVSAYAPEGLPGANHPFLFRPNSARIKVGTKYAISISTQCGLQSPTGPDFDGSFWDVADRHIFNTRTVLLPRRLPLLATEATSYCSRTTRLLTTAQPGQPFASAAMSVRGFRPSAHKNVDDSG
jgi:hypothetical protein